jgi:uncharacterized protein YndB with AHSA1/START domain
VSDGTQSQVQLEHFIKASPARVFDAWIDTDLLGQWMFGSRVRDETVLTMRNEAKVGGAFRFTVERNEQIIEYVGEYFIVDRPNRLVFTWAVEEYSTESDHVIVTFEADKSGCLLKLTHNLHPERTDHSADVLNDWPKMLAALEKVLAGR